MNKEEANRLADRSWRMDNLYRIKDKEGKLVTFKMNRVQKHFDDNRHTRNVMCKSRQHGVSTYKIIDGLDKVLFSYNKTVDAIIIAHKQDDAKKLFNNKLKMAWQLLPEKIRGMYQVNTDTAQEMRVNVGTKENPFINSISVATSARSGTYQFGHITELSTMDKEDPQKAEEVMTGIVPAIPMYGDLDIESTAKGNSGYFHDIFMEAWDRQQSGSDYKLTPKEYKAFFYPWMWDEYELGQLKDEQIKYSIKTMQEVMKDYQKEHKLSDREITFYYFTWLSWGKSWDFMKQEYPTTVEEAFAAGSDSLYDISLLKDQIVVPGRKNSAWTYHKEPEARHIYAIGSDVSEGIGLDASTACIWDFTPLLYGGIEKPEVVATFKSDKTDPTQLAYELMNAGKMYNEALIAVERNNHGHATIGKLTEIYPQSKVFMDESKKFGWLTTTRTKPAALYGLQEGLNNENVKLNSQALISEMTSFPRDKAAQAKPKKDDTKHWDLLMAAAIGYQMQYYVRKPRPNYITKPKSTRRQAY